MDKSGSQDIEWFELPIEHGSAVESEPLVQHSCIDSAEFDIELQRAVVQISEAGLRTDQAAFELAAGQEDRGGSAVVGAAPAVLFERSAEL